MKTKYGEIEEKFYKGESPKAKTVAEAIELLKELPGNLPIEGDFNDGFVYFVVYNVKTNKPFLCIEDF